MALDRCDLAIALHFTLSHYLMSLLRLILFLIHTSIKIFSEIFT